MGTKAAAGGSLGENTGTSMTTGSTHGEAAKSEPLHPVSLIWVLKRAVLGIALLALLTGSVAWLTYDPVGAASGSASAAFRAGSTAER